MTPWLQSGSTWRHEDGSTIEQVGVRYKLYTAHGCLLGSFSSLEAAQDRHAELRKLTARTPLSKGAQA